MLTAKLLELSVDSTSSILFVTRRYIVFEERHVHKWSINYLKNNVTKSDVIELRLLLVLSDL
jgi:hypothetical protein